MSVLAAGAVGLLAYLVAGAAAGVISPSTWPGRWRAGGPRIGSITRPNAETVRRIGLAALSATGVFAVVVLTTRSFLIASFGFAMVGVWSARRPARIRAKSLGELREAWPDGVRQLLASVRSGSTVEAALVDLAHNGPFPLRRLLVRFPDLVAAIGVEAALETVRSEAEDPTTDRVVEVLIVAGEIGGRVVPDILEDIADSVRADLRTIEEIHTSSLEQRLNARVVFLVPWLLLALLTSRDGAYRMFYQSRPGATIIAIAAVLSAVAMFAVGRLAKEPLEPRVFGTGSEQKP